MVVVTAFHSYCRLRCGSYFRSCRPFAKSPEIQALLAILEHRLPAKVKKGQERRNQNGMLEVYNFFNECKGIGLK